MWKLRKKCLIIVGMKFLKRLLAGMGIGVGAAIPGVSGAAIAVILKVYTDIIDAVNTFRKHAKEALRVLLPIVLGIIIAVIPCIIVFKLAFQYMMFVLICLFCGFLIGSFPAVTDEVKGVKPCKKQIIIIVLSAIFVIMLGVLSIIFGDKINLNELFRTMPVWLYFVLIPVGLVAAVALTVPGLSGSLILLIIGFYRPLLDFTVEWCKELLSGNAMHIGQLFGMIGCFAIGVLLGIILVSKIMTRLLANHHDSTFFGIIGFILGSLVVLFLNYEIFNYYKVWGGAVIENVTPKLPIYAEIPIGIVVLALAAALSYYLVRKQRQIQNEKRGSRGE